MIMKIYTKTGDAGKTSLFDNSRVRKSDGRVDAYGEVDELNACLGVARAAGLDADISLLVETLQRQLFALGARLADPAARLSERVTKASLGDADVTAMEAAIRIATAPRVHSALWGRCRGGLPSGANGVSPG